jgi:hypothetical protein
MCLFPFNRKEWIDDDDFDDNYCVYDEFIDSLNNIFVYENVGKYAGGLVFVDIYSKREYDRNPSYRFLGNLEDFIHMVIEDVEEFGVQSYEYIE